MSKAIRYLAFSTTVLWFGLAPANAQLSDAQERRSYMVKELNLSSAQVDAVQAVRNKHRPEINRLRLKKNSLKEELWDMARRPAKGAEYRSQLIDKHQEVQAAQIAFENKRFEMLLEAREILEPQQIAHIEDVLKRRWRYHKWRHQRRLQQAQQDSVDPLLQMQEEEGKENAKE